MEAAKWNGFPKNTTCYNSGLTGPTRFYHIIGRAATTTKVIHAKLDKTHLSWLLHSSMPESGPLNCWDNICDENRATDIIKVNYDKYMPHPPFPVQNNPWYIQEYTALASFLELFLLPENHSSPSGTGQSKTITGFSHSAEPPCQVLTKVYSSTKVLHTLFSSPPPFLSH